MKIIKVTITLMMCFISLISFGQNLKNGIFYTTFQTGVGEEVPMKFHIDSADIVKIKKTKLYKDWDSTTFSDPENAEFIKKYKKLTHFEIFLMCETDVASYYARFELKNYNSYTPINGTSNIKCESEGITIVFPMKAQNDYGNFIISKAYYTVSWVDGKQKDSIFIY